MDNINNNVLNTPNTKYKRRISIQKSSDTPKKIKILDNENEKILRLDQQQQKEIQGEKVVEQQEIQQQEEEHHLLADDIDLESMSIDDYRQTKELFEIFDFDQDGFISKDDLKIVLNSLNEDSSPEFINQMFIEIIDDSDSDNNGDDNNNDKMEQSKELLISYNQFCKKYMYIKFIDIEQHLKSSFDIFEEESSSTATDIVDQQQGFIKVNELDQLLFKLAGDNLSKQDISLLVNECIDLEKTALQENNTTTETDIEKIKVETFLTVMMKKFKKNILQRQPSGLISKSLLPIPLSKSSNLSTSLSSSSLSTLLLQQPQQQSQQEDLKKKEYTNNLINSLKDENNNLNYKLKSLENLLNQEKQINLVDNRNNENQFQELNSQIIILEDTIKQLEQKLKESTSNSNGFFNFWKNLKSLFGYK